MGNNYRKAVNIKEASEIYVSVDDSVTINTQARNWNRKETGLKIEYCRAAYGKPAQMIFDEIINAYQRGEKVYILSPLPSI